LAAATADSDVRRLPVGCQTNRSLCRIVWATVFSHKIA
jgi:hypothetical protein